MKIYNLILLNVYFLQLFPLLFGMYQGEGPSGSQPGGMHPGEGSGSQQPEDLAFSRLDNQIRPMLEIVGDAYPYSDLVQPLQNTEHVQPGTNVGEQYANLALVYNNLSKDIDIINEELEVSFKQSQDMDQPHNEQLINQIIASYNNDIQKICERQDVLMADMIKVRTYVRQHYNDYLDKQNADASGQEQHGQGQHEHGQQGQGHRGQMEHVQGHRVQGRRSRRRGGNRASDSGN